MKLKRTLAAIIAATTMAVGIGSFSAEAAIIENKTWQTTYVTASGAPGSATQSPVLTLTASAYKYTVGCLSMTDTPNRSVTTVSTTHQMRNVSNTANIPNIEHNNTGSISFRIVNSGTTAKFKISSYSSTADVFSANGNLYITNN